MPVMDGTTALKHIREINPKIPIIAETAYATIEERAEYESLGFDHYLVKPISQQELYHALYSVFTRK
jgi:CheY-like chemotaxis protein